MVFGLRIEHYGKLTEYGIDGVDWFSMYRASFGTTKYCTYFLRNLPCNNPDCMYLHELGETDDSFTKEEIASGYVTFVVDD